MSKVFCIGSNKTGTTSLTKSLQILGYSVCPEHLMFSINSKHFYNQSIGNYTELFKLVDEYDAFEDRPWNHSDFYKKLDENFENSKFILTIRDTDNWINSYRRWSKKINLKGGWFYKLVSNICYGVDDFLSNENIMRTKYEQRNQEIINYFKGTDKLLILNFEESQNWGDLCNFLDKPKPTLNFPHLNKTK